MALAGRIAVSEFNFNGGDTATASLRLTDPDSVAADLLEARNLLQQRQPRQAATAVRRVLAKQPHHLEAMGLLAATEALQLHDDQTKHLLADVDRVSPANDAGPTRRWPTSSGPCGSTRGRPPCTRRPSTAPRGGASPATARGCCSPRAATRSPPAGR